MIILPLWWLWICGSKICILQTLDDCARRRHEQFCDPIPILEPIPILLFHGRSTLSTNAQFFNLFLHSWYSAGRCRKLGTWSEEYFIPETHGTFGTNQLWTWVPLWIAGPVPFFLLPPEPYFADKFACLSDFFWVVRVKVQACWLDMIFDIFVAKSLHFGWPKHNFFDSTILAGSQGQCCHGCCTWCHGNSLGSNGQSTSAPIWRPSTFDIQA